MVEVREINDAESLSSLRSSWNELLAVTPRASFFQSLDWLETYWRHFGQSQRLRVLLISREHELSGIVPLTVRTESTRLGPVHVLTYPLHDWGTFYGPIGRDPAAVLSAAAEHVKATPRDWDLFDLRWVDEMSTDRIATARALKQAGLSVRRDVWNHCPQVELVGTWDNYWASRTSRWRNNVRRSEKKLAALGEIAYVRYRPFGADRGDGDSRWDLYEACEQVARESWQAKSDSGTTITHEAIRPFLQNVHEAAARTGSLDVNLLYLDRRPVAFNYAYHWRGYVYGLRTGYVADRAVDGAGSVLQMHMIRDSFARNDRLYDLGPGYLDCKRYWQTRIATSYRYTYFPPGLRPQLLRGKRFLAAWLRERRAKAGTHPRVATRSTAT